MSKPPKPKPSPASKTEHIFPASYLEPLAVKWKELNAQGKHVEAMAVLEDIVIGSTQMFEALAQHEGYHYTVDLSILVSAAQEKVVKWLLRWQRKKGKLFSWFCLHERTPILLENGTFKTIKELVEAKYSGNVKCWNTELSKFESRRVTDWSKAPSTRKEWRKLCVYRPSGYGRPIFITKDHLVWTQNGWTRVDALTPDDVLTANTPRLTLDGQAAMLGMYLGDGSILKKAFRVTHGKAQRFYNDWLAEKFQGFMYGPADGATYFNTFTKKNMDYTGQTNLCISAADMWLDFAKLEHPKSVTKWVLDRLTPVSLAFWYMDDGSYLEKTGATTLATHGFSKKECNLLINCLASKFQIVARRHKPGGLYIEAASRDRFFSLIAPYVLPGFSYKLSSKHRLTKKAALVLVEDNVSAVTHKSKKADGDLSWEVRRKFKPNGQCGETSAMFKWKYDLTVEGEHNFFAGKCRLLVHNSKCSKNAFRSELVKVNQFRKRYHVTGDNLEKFFASEDHASHKEDAAAEVRNKLSTLTCRWGSPQEIGTIRFLIECILEEDHDKQAAIRGAAYAWGVSVDMAKFFYSWAVVAMRDQMYQKVRVPFTEEDLVRLTHSYSDFVTLFDLAGTPFNWPIHGKYLVAVFGGKRIRVPTLRQLDTMKHAKAIFDEVEASDKDPDTVAEIGERYGKTARTAQELYNEMVENLDPRRSGEFDVYGDNH